MGSVRFFFPPLMEKCIENKNWEEFCKAKRIIIPLVLNSSGKGVGSGKLRI